MRRGFYWKLAAGNIRKNSKTYLPYILTCIVTVAIFYIMRSLTRNPGLNNIIGGSFIHNVLALGSAVVSIFAVIFLFYTSSFLMKRRKKEFGLFNILGMERRHLARVAGWETVYVTLAGLFLGVMLGIALDKAMFLVMLRITGREVALGFFVSGKAVMDTVGIFVSIFALIYIHSVWQICRVDPIELLRAGNVGEEEPKAKWLLALLGLCFLGGGYTIAITTQNPIASVMMFFVAVLLVILGTYLLFVAGSIALLKLLRKNKRFYYQTKHFVSVSGMIYRMKQNAVGLANICILSTMVLVMVSTTTSMMLGMEDIIRNRYPADFMLYLEGKSGEREGEMEAVRRLQKEWAMPVTREWIYTYLAFPAVREGEGFSVKRDRAFSVEDDTYTFFFITLSDYNAVMGEEKTLQTDEIMIYSNRQKFDGSVLRLFEKEYHVVERLKDFVGNGLYESMISATQYVVVPDEETIDWLYERQKESLEDFAREIRCVYSFDTAAGEEEQMAFYYAMEDLFAADEGHELEVRADGRKAYLDINGGLFFIGIFLGTLFVMATVLIIYYKQISEGYEDKKRFEILQKVGMSRAEVKAAIRSQVLTVFFLPLLLAGIHVVAAFPLLSKLLALLNLYRTGLYMACTAVCFLSFGIMYVCIYALTAKNYYRIVSGTK